MVDDAITPERLEPALREHVHPSATCAALRRASIGNSQETWFVDVSTPAGERELVLRRSAAGGTLTWTDRAVEYAAVAAVGAAGLPVAPVLWLGELDRPYFVMERVSGAPPRRGDDVSRGLGDLLARLHALDPGGDLRALPGGGAAGELARWLARYREARLEPMPLAGALFAWLETHVPADVAPVLLWGDPGPHNMLVEDGRVTALLDWELAHFGHPLDDLGAAQWACFGILDPDAILAAYEDRAGPVDRDALRWFRCLACLSRTVMLLAANRAFAEGRTHRPSLAALGLDLVAHNLARGAGEAGWAPVAGGPRVSPARLRPGAAEIALGLSRFLAADVLPATGDRALRRELRNAVALLETLALRVEEPHEDRAKLEERARELELARSPDRGAMRARLLAEHAASEALLAPLRRLLVSR